LSTLKRLLKRRAIVIPLAVVVVAGAATGTWAGTRGGGSGSGSKTTEQLYTVATTTLRQTVSETGTIEAADTEDLSFPASGKVTGVDVTLGQLVTKGQKLATLDSASLRVSAAQAEVSLESARSRLSSDESAGASSAQLTADQASIDAASSQVDSANANLAEATMTSPIAGQVTQVNIATGDQLGSSSGSGGNNNQSSSSNSSSSSAQIEVVSKSLVVSVDVDTTVVDQIKTGVQAVITPTGSSTPIYGTVSSVGLVASTSSGVATFPVKITVTGTPTGVYPGTSSSVQIIYRQYTDVLAVPVAAGVML
jgi:multidrug efflux pump subunit AcrA (membrane-fusion protein)